MDSGKSQRMQILEDSFNRNYKSMLTSHSWKFEILERVENGEYIVIQITRAKTVKKFAILYSCATKNEVYKVLDQKVDIIVLNGEYYHLESYAYGITTRVIERKSFFDVLKQWNNESDSDELIVETANKRENGITDFPSRIESETPIEQIWQYLKLFSNKALSRNVIVKRYSSKNDVSDEIINLKSEGLAFCMQNACDYFQIKKEQKVSQRIINLYYGMISFASAEIIASSNSQIGLKEIENFTKYGHGLYTVDGSSSNSFENLNIGVLSNGFFKEWMKSIGKNTELYPTKKAKIENEIDETYTCNILQLFARIPELEFVFGQVCNDKFRCIEVIHDYSGNQHGHDNINNGKYILIQDHSYSSTPEEIRKWIVNTNLDNFLKGISFKFCRRQIA